MPQTEELLQELVDLKKKEMRDASRRRWASFIFYRLPVIALLIFGFYTSWKTINNMQNLLENGPEINLEGEIDQIKDFFN